MAFQQNVHNFRALAIIGVVAAHCLHNFNWQGSEITFIVLDVVFNQSTIWFAFIAGYLFQRLSANYTTEKYYRKKTANVILPYLLCSIPALTLSLTLFTQEMPPDFYGSPVWKQVFYFLVTGKHLAPYWYIPTITCIFIASPILIYIDRNSSLYWALPPLLILSALLGRDGLIAYTDLNAYYGQISKAVYLLSPYMLGMFISRHSNQAMYQISKYRVVLTLLTMSLFLLEVTFYRNTTYLMFAWKIFSAPLLLYFLSFPNNIAQKPIDRVADVSFGIFFLHGYFLPAHKILWAYVSGESALPTASLVAYFIFVGAIVLLCVFLISLIQRFIPKYSKQLIGC